MEKGMGPWKKVGIGILIVVIVVLVLALGFGLTDTVDAPVNGGWTVWANEGTCDAGLQKQTRTCTNPAPANGGTQCTGISTQTVPCLINGGWSEWVSEGTCVAGSKSQKRTCTNPSPAN